MDISTDFQVVSGRTALAQALLRRWTTDRGQLIDDPNYGDNLENYINDDMSIADIAKAQQAAVNEALKDERVVDCTSIASFDDSGVLTLEFTITDGDGPFSLTLAVTDVTVDLLTVGS